MLYVKPKNMNKRCVWEKLVANVQPIETKIGIEGAPTASENERKNNSKKCVIFSPTFLNSKCKFKSCVCVVCVVCVCVCVSVGAPILCLHDVNRARHICSTIKPKENKSGLKS